MLKFYLLLTVVFSVFFYGFAGAENKNTQEAELIKKADGYFASGRYEEALPHYSRLLSVNPEKTKYVYRFGVCLLMAGKEKSNAATFLYLAAKDSLAPVDVFYYLGRSYLINNEYTKAKRAFETFQRKEKSGTLRKYDLDVYLANCENGISLLEQRKNVIIVHSSQLSLESSYKNFDFSSAAGRVVKAADEFLSALDRAKQKDPVMYVSNDRTTLLIPSYGKKGENGKDIYMAHRTAGNAWSIPENIGPVINSPADEDFPFLDLDGRTLYFSSKGHNSIGGYDIFKSVYNPVSNQWSAPENLGIPINTSGDDFLFVPGTEEATASYLTTEESGKSTASLRTIRIPSEHNRMVTITGVYLPLDQKIRRDARITVLTGSGDGVLTTVHTDPQNGNYKLVLPSGSSFMLVVEGGGYVPHAELFEIPADVAISDLRQVIKINKLNLTEKLILENYFSAGIASTVPTNTFSRSYPAENDSLALTSFTIEGQTIYATSPVSEAPGKALAGTAAPADSLAAQPNGSDELADGVKKAPLPTVKIKRRDKFDPTLGQGPSPSVLLQKEEEAQRKEELKEDESTPEAIFNSNVSNKELAEIAYEDAQTTQAEADSLYREAGKLKKLARAKEELANTFRIQAEEPGIPADSAKALLELSANNKNESQEIFAEVNKLKYSASMKETEAETAISEANEIFNLSKSTDLLASNSNSVKSSVSRNRKDDKTNKDTAEESTAEMPYKLKSSAKMELETAEETQPATAALGSSQANDSSAALTDKSKSVDNHTVAEKNTSGNSDPGKPAVAKPLAEKSVTDQAVATALPPGPSVAASPVNTGSSAMRIPEPKSAEPLAGNAATAPAGSTTVKDPVAGKEKPGPELTSEEPLAAAKVGETKSAAVIPPVEKKLSTDRPGGNSTGVNTKQVAGSGPNISAVNPKEATNAAGIRKEGVVLSTPETVSKNAVTESVLLEPKENATNVVAIKEKSSASVPATKEPKAPSTTTLSSNEKELKQTPDQPAADAARAQTAGHTEKTVIADASNEAGKTEAVPVAIAKVNAPAPVSVGNTPEYNPGSPAEVALNTGASQSAPALKQQSPVTSSTKATEPAEVKKQTNSTEAPAVQKEDVALSGKSSQPGKLTDIKPATEKVTPVPGEAPRTAAANQPFNPTERNIAMPVNDGALEAYREFQQKMKKSNELTAQSLQIQNQIEHSPFTPRRDSLVRVSNELSLQSIREWQEAQQKIKTARNLDPGIDYKMGVIDYPAAATSTSSGPVALAKTKPARVEAAPVTSSTISGQVPAGSGNSPAGLNSTVREPASPAKSSEQKNAPVAVNQEQMKDAVNASAVPVNSDDEKYIDTKHEEYPTYKKLKEEISNRQVETINEFASAINLNKKSGEEKEMENSLRDKAASEKSEKKKKEMLKEADEYRARSEQHEKASVEKFTTTQQKINGVKALNSDLEMVRNRITLKPENTAIAGNTPDAATRQTSPANGSNTFALTPAEKKDARMENAPVTIQPAASAPVSNRVGDAASLSPEEKAASSVPDPSSVTAKEKITSSVAVSKPVQDPVSVSSQSKVASENTMPPALAIEKPLVPASPANSDASVGKPSSPASNTASTATAPGASKAVATATAKGNATVSVSGKPADQKESSPMKQSKQEAPVPAKETGKTESLSVTEEDIAAATISKKETDDILSSVFSINGVSAGARGSEIPMDPPLPEGLVFKVQISAFRKPIAADNFNGLEPLTGESTRPGWIRYCVGMFKTFEPANMVKKEIRKIGYKDAFVVAYYNGKRIELHEAYQLIRDQENLTAYRSQSAKEIAILRAANLVPHVSADPAGDNDELAFFGKPALPANGSALSQPTSLDPAREYKADFSEGEYSVQVGVYHNPKAPAGIASVKDLQVDKIAGKLYRFTSGRFTDYSTAESARDRIRGQGIPDAFIVLYKGGKTEIASEKNTDLKRSASVVSVSPEKTINIRPSVATKEITYKVQIGAYKNDVPFNMIESYISINDEGITTQLDERELHIFYAGGFADYARADQLRSSIVGKGVKDAFVVALQNGKRISITDEMKAGQK